MKFYPQGDSALFVETGESITVKTSRLNREMIKGLTGKQLRGIKESVLSYTGFTVYFDPLIITQGEVRETIHSLIEEINETEAESVGPGIVIPVAYGGDYGPDIKFVAETNGLTPGEVVQIHSGAEYVVHMIGFTPGFPYLGGMSKAIATPRKREPELRVEAGSVGIAGDQTGIYPVQSPGGWQIIGRTPLALFDTERKPEFLASAGMRIRFRPVDNLEFWNLCELTEAGDYKYERF